MDSTQNKPDIMSFEVVEQIENDCKKFEAKTPEILGAMASFMFESVSDEDKSKMLLAENPHDLRKICITDECGKRIDYGITTHGHPIVGFHFCFEHAAFLSTGSGFHVYVKDGYHGFKLIYLENGETLTCNGCHEKIEPETVCFSLQDIKTYQFIEYYHFSHTPSDHDMTKTERPRCIVLEKGKTPSYEKLRHHAETYHKKKK
jgi:hypothetical protein